ncbi:UNVERIFIED_ORG: chromate reductase [Xanthobacter viscosus]|uniref:NAD(P)H-dependent oxidoreductase n=1 Tax=Xanthobacter autotrophicus TaxID=280 RepID=A0A6C1KPI2_XANAU|nr:NAD(P)H-dependent oxidoreductase [Xanthobacter autotrophicus]TLX41436.1 NAD(P)H-dependent oxidoreductase [Xanthobacter autotrophicus]
MSVHVAVIVGSLRKGAFSRSIALALKEIAAPRLDLGIVEIGDLPLYNPDLDGETPPAPWARFRGEVAASDAVLFVTPEYNRSIPGGLKNALDVGSRPYGKSVWSGKPAAIVSVSPGLLGAFGANHHLRQPLVFLDMPILQQPEAYISKVGDLLDADGRLTSDATKDFLKTFADKFADWIALTVGK